MAAAASTPASGTTPVHPPIRFRHDPGECDLLPVMLSLVLEGTSGNLATMPYYRKASRHAHEHDPALVGMMTDMVTWIRDKYRSARQHDFHAQRVPVTKTTDRRVRTHLDSDCAICLRPLKAPGHRLVRLKPASGNADECGHFFHKDCIGEWELRHLITPKSCPLCRVDLGIVVSTWEDHESFRPQF
jgi:hypothetical protein